MVKKSFMKFVLDARAVNFCQYQGASVITNRSTEFEHVHSATEVRPSHRMIHLESFIPRAPLSDYKIGN